MKKTKLSESVEIMSFNDQVPELPSLIELDDMDLEAVSGGDCGVNCGTNCGTYSKPILIAL